VVIVDNQAVIPLAAQMYANGVVTEGTVNTRWLLIEYAE
jgi:major type 1 subunit fimbrin (pilin)